MACRKWQCAWSLMRWFGNDFRIIGQSPQLWPKNCIYDEIYIIRYICYSTSDGCQHLTYEEITSMCRTDGRGRVRGQYRFQCHDTTSNGLPISLPMEHRLSITEIFVARKGWNKVYENEISDSICLGIGQKAWQNACFLNELVVLSFIFLEVHCFVFNWHLLSIWVNGSYVTIHFLNQESVMSCCATSKHCVKICTIYEDMCATNKYSHSICGM